MKRILFAAVYICFGVLLIASVRTDAEERYKLGQALFENNSLSLSNVIFRSVASDFPESEIAPDASFMAAEALYKKGDYRAAFNSYSEADENYPQAKNRFRKEIYYRMALCSLKLDDYEKGAYYASYVADKYPDSYLEPDACLLAAENYFNKGDYVNSIKFIGRLEKYADYKNMDYAYYLAARVYYERYIKDREKNRDDSENAFKYFHRIETEYKGSSIYPRAMFWKANLYYSNGKYKDAIKLADISASLEKDERFKATVMYFKAWCHYMLSDYEKALSIFDETASMYPDFATAPWSKYKSGLCLQAMNKNKEAVLRFQSVINEHPGTIPQEYASFALADSFFKSGDYIEAFEIFIEIKNSGIKELSIPSYYMAGESLMKSEKYREAAAVYDELAAKHSSESSEAKYMKAWCLFKDSDYIKASEMFKEIENDAANDKELRGRSLLKLGDIMYARGMNKEAEEIYNKAAYYYEKYSGIVFEALYGIGWVKYRESDYEGASLMFASARKKAPGAEAAARADIMDANCRYSLLKFEEAQEIYDRVSVRLGVSQDIKNEARFYSAWCDYRLGRFDQAAAKWERYGAETKDPVKKAESIYRRGWAFFRKNDFDNAIKSFDIIIEKYPSTHFMQEALLKKGDCYYNKGDFEKAIISYKTLVESHPSHYRVPEALYGIQWSYYQLGRDEEAVKISKDFLDKFGNSPFASEVQYRVGEHYYNVGNYRAAIDEFGKYIEKNKEGTLMDNALYFTAMSRMALNENAEAVQPLKRLISEFPKSNLKDRAKFKLATCYFKLNDFVKAAEDFSAYELENPSSEYADDALFNAGISYKRINDNAAAERMYRKLVEQYPSSPLAERGRMNLGYLYQDNGRYEEALKTFREVAEMKGKKAAEALFWIGDTYQSQGNTSAAHAAYLEVYEKFKKDEVWAVPALDASGRLYEKNNELKKAIDIYRKIEKGGYSKKYTEIAKKKADILMEQYKLLNPAGTSSGAPLKQKTEPAKDGAK